MNISDLPKASQPQPAQKRASGNWNADWEPFAKLDPAWTEKVIAMAIAPSAAGVLDRKTIELIGIAPSHSACPESGRDQGRNHRSSAAGQPPRAAQHVRRRAYFARRTRSQRATQLLTINQLKPPKETQ
jgi:hypothetical protein